MPKRPKQQVSVKAVKKPTILENPDSFLDENPAWDFTKFDELHEKWGLNCQEEKVLKDFFYCLKFQQTRKWKEILHDTNGRSHYPRHKNINITLLIGEVSKRLNDLHLEYDELFSMSVNNHFRVWGILENGKLYILWLDPHHDLYKCKER